LKNLIDRGYLHVIPELAFIAPIRMNITLSAIKIVIGKNLEKSDIITGNVVEKCIGKFIIP